MCRSIKTLRTEPEWSDDDVRAAALQYVRKLSGFRSPSKQNVELFQQAVNDVADATMRMLNELSPNNHVGPNGEVHTHSH